MKEQETKTHYALDDAYRKLVEQGLDQSEIFNSLVKTFGAKDVSEWLKIKSEEVK